MSRIPPELNQVPRQTAANCVWLGKPLSVVLDVTQRRIVLGVGRRRGVGCQLRIHREMYRGWLGERMGLKLLCLNSQEGGLIRKTFMIRWYRQAMK